ncbi:transglycosylase domain-containing protein [Sporosarcina trichiuri]|uniref:transglycosylase domain-containing protein n=1 Tax=Sporosarcina trichiuri TaxID=3056445 RepID=UPI0025B293A6|nr:PBP1A family penicillin-binding protein [Sporosarcina sp. 0.2-SM1T-5]WJY28062.1 PBP1A family penicillin-binding protein [Sporosarcina sp. 0.2-SM1T-5]
MKRSEYKQYKKEHKKTMKQKLSLKKRVLRFTIIGALLAALSAVLVLNLFIAFSDVSELDKPAPRSTVITDPDGNVIRKVSNSKIEGVSIDQIPQTLRDAVVSVEDQRFYKHHGLNYFSMGRALAGNALKGKIVSGGSTITQQLAKNVFLTQDRTFSRKLKELILAKKIERTFSKEEILERYLNYIYFGDGAWGVQRAAQTYFGKDVSELTLSESATLAGLLKAPSNLSPRKNLDKSVARRNLVLSLMLKEQYISQEEYDAAVGQKLELAASIVPKDNGNYPYYIDRVVDEAVDMYGLTKDEVLSGGLHITTAINPVVQDALEAVYADDGNFPESPPDQLLQSASVFVSPKTGGILALVGGRGEYTPGRFNNATELLRQPGSALKPLAVYAPALEKGYHMSDLLEDEPIDIGGYAPTNIDQQYRGHVTLYEALVNSYNVPPVWLLDQIGIQNGVDAVERFGIPLTKKDRVLGLALGGLDKGTSPLRMAQAFSAFANEGVMEEAHAIMEIKDADGKVLGTWQGESVQVTDAEVAAQMTYMLQGAVEEGTGRNARISGMDVAGKTGTTQLPIEGVSGSKDNWFVGYTPDIAGAVWLGYDKTDADHYLTSTSSTTASPIFAKVVSRSASELSGEAFDLSLIDDDIKDLKKQEKKAKKKRKKDEKKKEKDEKGKGFWESLEEWGQKWFNE